MIKRRVVNNIVINNYSLVSKYIYTIGNNYLKYVELNTNNIYYSYMRLFIGTLLKRGRKMYASKLFFDLKEILKIKKGEDPFFIFFISLLIVTPKVYLLKVSMGSVKREIPKPLNIKKQKQYAIKWTLKKLKMTNRRLDLDALADLLLLCLERKGTAYSTKTDLYKKSLDNRFLLKLIR